MQVTHPSKHQLLQIIGKAVLETVSESGDTGAPGGLLYAALMAHGATLQQYTSFMETLVSKEMLTLEGDSYLITEKGKAFLITLQKLHPTKQ